MQDLSLLVNAIIADQPKGYKPHPRQIEAAKAIYAEAVNQGIDPRFAMAVGFQETKWGGNGKTAIYKSPENDKGRGSAMGFMQVLRGTAQEVGYGDQWDAAKTNFEKTGEGDATLSAKIGVAYLKKLSDVYGAKTNSDLAAAYYGGPGVLKKSFSGQVRKYVEEVVDKVGVLDGTRIADWKASPLLMPARSRANGAAPAQIESFAQNTQQPSMPNADQMATAAPMQAPQKVASLGILDQSSSTFDPLAYAASNNTMPMTGAELGFESAISRLSDGPLQSAALSDLSQPDSIEVLRREIAQMYDEIEGVA